MSPEERLQRIGLIDDELAALEKRQRELHIERDLLWYRNDGLPLHWQHIVRAGWLIHKEEYQDEKDKSNDDWYQRIVFRPPDAPDNIYLQLCGGIYEKKEPQWYPHGAERRAQPEHWLCRCEDPLFYDYQAKSESTALSSLAEAITRLIASMDQGHECCAHSRDLFSDLRTAIQPTEDTP